MEYVAIVNDRFYKSDDALVNCPCGQLYWSGWHRCPNCKRSQNDEPDIVLEKGVEA